MDICMQCQWRKEVCTSLSFCFPLLVIIQKNWNVLNAPLDTLSSGVAACQLVLNFLERASIQQIWQKYQRTFCSASKCFSITRLSINIFLLCPSKIRAGYFHISELQIIKPKIVYNVQNWNSEFWRGIWNTCQRLIPWWSLSKFFVLKRLGWDVLHKESSSPFLFTMCILKSVFCWDISVEHEFDRCQRIEVETQPKMTETHS